MDAMQGRVNSMMGEFGENQMGKLDSQLKDVMAQMNQLKDGGGLKEQMETMSKQVEDMASGPLEDAIKRNKKFE